MLIAPPRGGVSPADRLLLPVPEECYGDSKSGASTEWSDSVHVKCHSHRHAIWHGHTMLNGTGSSALFGWNLRARRFERATRCCAEFRAPREASAVSEVS